MCDELLCGDRDGVGREPVPDAAEPDETIVRDLIIQPGSADVCGRGMIEEFFLDGVPIEPRDGAQPPGDGGAARPRASNSRANVSMSARRTENSDSERRRHQAVNWRRSRV